MTDTSHANHPTVTVALPTYYGGPAIIKTVESILRSAGTPPFRLIITVDGNPLKPEVEGALKRLGAEIIFNEERGGQTERIKQLIDICQTDILILTQDDVTFTPTTIAEILLLFAQRPEVTMIGANIKPAPPENFLERVIEVGVRIRDNIGRRWHTGDNYLMSIGRCLAFRAAAAKRLNIPGEMINSDAYLYFENKKIGGTFAPCTKAIIYNKSPQRLKEHLKQSRRFHDSQKELSMYTDVRLSSEYTIPWQLTVTSLSRECTLHPILATCYLAVSMLSYFGNKKTALEKRFWETDISTKR